VSLIDSLIAGPNPDLALFGRFVGDRPTYWTNHRMTGTRRTS
jgi:hypothetical protein